jgi:hypothetical protein
MQIVTQDNQIMNMLTCNRALPADPKRERVVLWRIFRDQMAALEYSHHILLEPDQQLVGGHGFDSAGEFYWLGVEVEDLAAWGHPHAIQLSDPFEAEDPKIQGRGFGNEWH